MSDVIPGSAGAATRVVRRRVGRAAAGVAASLLAPFSSVNSAAASLGAAARVVRRRVGAAGVTAGALAVSSVPSVAAEALRRARLTRVRGAALWLAIWSAAGFIELGERADVCAVVSAVVSATVSAPVGAATFRVRLVRRGGRRVS